MLSAIKKYLQGLSKEDLKKLLKAADLTETEYWIIIYSCAEKRLVENTCMKLNISRAYYFILKNKALLKIHYTLKYLK